MRLISYQSDSGPRVAGVRQDGYVDLNRADSAVPSCVKQLLTQGAEGLRRAQAALTQGQAMSRQSAKLLAPVPQPQKIICIGLNYADHAKESGVEPPPEPVVFNKFATAVAAHGDPIVLPRVSAAVDYEAELVAVIARVAATSPRSRPCRTWLAIASGTMYPPATGN